MTVLSNPIPRWLTRVGLLSIAALAAASVRGGADEIEQDASWSRLRQEGKSFVFGRLSGRFDGTEYRGRKIRVRNRTTNDVELIDVEQGLGYFEASLPLGTYEVLSIEATYLPRVRPMNPSRFPPVPQRYAIRPIDGAGLPWFQVGEDPVYLGTILSGLGFDGTIYNGHALELADEYDEAWAHFQLMHRALAASLDASAVSPQRFFFLEPRPRPTEPGGALTLDSGEEPLSTARRYIAEGKFRQAIEWLSSTMPTTDRARSEIRFLTGEALLGDKRYSDAVDELGEALMADPESTRGLRLLARAHAFNGDTDDAVHLYRSLMEIEPRDAEANLHLGYYHALRSEAKLAEESFRAAFEVNFDYLLHDLSPYALALKAKNANYQPPEVVDGAAAVPDNMRSRRGSQGAFAILLDAAGKVVAAHITPGAESWAPATVMSLVRARFRPAKLNGVPIPCLVIVGADDVLEGER